MSDQAQKMTHPRDALANVLGIAIAVALVAVGIAYGIDALNRQAANAGAPSEPAVTVPVNISGAALEIPADWLRFTSQPDSTFSDRLDLTLSLDLGETAPVPVTLTLVPKSRARASSALLDTVYLQHFSDAETHGVPGLVGKPLKGDEGYAGETVWYDPIRINPFVAKCTPLPGEDTGGACLRTMVLSSGLAAILGFPGTALSDWRRLDTALITVFTRINAGKIVR